MRQVVPATRENCDSAHSVLIASGIGLAVGAIREAPAQGSPRMDFGSWYLQDGLQLVIVDLGVFAVPEIGSPLRRDGAISETSTLGAGC